MKRIFINTGDMRQNLKDGGRRPVIGVEEVRADGSVVHVFDCMEVEIVGPCRIIFRPEEPAAEGASVVYVVTTAPVVPH